MGREDAIDFGIGFAVSVMPMVSEHYSIASPTEWVAWALDSIRSPVVQDQAAKWFSGASSRYSVERVDPDAWGFHIGETGEYIEYDFR